MTISPDWSVATPHEIDLERIATALGGYLSCVDLVDREVPALRQLVQLRARRVLPDLVIADRGQWTLRQKPSSCRCAQGWFGSATEAADHAREPLHVARLHDAVPRVVERLLAEVERAHGTAFYLPPDDIEVVDVVRERDGAGQLWAAGLHPVLVRRLHDELWPDGPALPVRFYVGAVVRRPDLRWIADTLTAAPDEDVATWLCWTGTELDRRYPTARADWLRAGVPRRAITALVEGGYSPADVARVASDTDRSAVSAACTLAAWARAGCHPSVEEIAFLHELDVDPWFEPSTATLDWIWQRIPRTPEGWSRTRLGLLLAVCGTGPATVWAIKHGVREARAAARLMATFE